MAKSDEEPKEDILIKELMDEYTPEELAQQLIEVSVLWDKVPPEVKSYVLHYDKLIGLVKRDYKRDEGILMQVWFEPTSYKFLQHVFEYNREHRDEIIEKRVRKIQAGSIMAVDLIMKQEKPVEPEIKVAQES